MRIITEGLSDSPYDVYEDYSEKENSVIMMRGLPASGKSTVARTIQKQSDKLSIINKDSFRSMIGLSFDRKLENAVVQGQRNLASALLKNGFSIIVDDTNLSEKYFSYWKQLAEDNGCNFYAIEMLTSVEDCIERDSKREASVGKDVIMGMYSHFNGPYKGDERNYAPQPKDKPKAVIIDIDGTLALRTNRGPFDESRYSNDIVNEPVHWLIKTLPYNVTLLFLSGRKGTPVGSASTVSWIQNNIDVGGRQISLMMRDKDDNRGDDVVKKEIYETRIKGRYNVKFVLDDRDKVVKMWRDELNLPTFQVYWGNF
jgi:predicted kinase